MKGTMSPEVQAYLILAHAGGSLEEYVLVDRLRRQVQASFLAGLFQTRAARARQAIKNLVGLGCFTETADGRVTISAPLKMYSHSDGVLAVEFSLRASGHGVDVKYYR